MPKGKFKLKKNRDTYDPTFLNKIEGLEALVDDFAQAKSASESALRETVFENNINNTSERYEILKEQLQSALDDEDIISALHDNDILFITNETGMVISPRENLEATLVPDSSSPIPELEATRAPKRKQTSIPTPDELKEMNLSNSILGKTSDLINNINMLRETHKTLQSIFTDQPRNLANALKILSRVLPPEKQDKIYQTFLPAYQALSDINIPELPSPTLKADGFTWETLHTLAETSDKILLIKADAYFKKMQETLIPELVDAYDKKLPAIFTVFNNAEPFLDFLTEINAKPPKHAQDILAKIITTLGSQQNTWFLAMRDFYLNPAQKYGVITGNLIQLSSDESAEKKFNKERMRGMTPTAEEIETFNTTIKNILNEERAIFNEKCTSLLTTLEEARKLLQNDPKNKKNIKLMNKATLSAEQMKNNLDITGFQKNLEAIRKIKTKNQTKFNSRINEINKLFSSIEVPRKNELHFIPEKSLKARLFEKIANPFRKLNTKTNNTTDEPSSQTEPLLDSVTLNKPSQPDTPIALKNEFYKLAQKCFDEKEALEKETDNLLSSKESIDQFFDAYDAYKKHVAAINESIEQLKQIVDNIGESNLDASEAHAYSFHRDLVTLHPDVLKIRDRFIYNSQRLDIKPVQQATPPSQPIASAPVESAAQAEAHRASIKSPASLLANYELSTEEESRASLILKNSPDARKTLFGDNPQVIITARKALQELFQKISYDTSTDYSGGKHEARLKKLLASERVDFENKKGKLKNISGLDLYNLALKEEYNDPRFRFAVFSKCLRTISGPKWENHISLVIAGASGAGKSTSSDAMLAMINDLEKNKPGANPPFDHPNYVLRVDGSVERDVSQVKKLALKTVIYKGYSGISDLDDSSNNPAKLKNAIEKTAESLGNVSVDAPLTFAGGGKAAKLFWRPGERLAQRLAKGSLESGENAPHVIFGEVVSPEGHEAEFDALVAIQGQLRAYLLDPHTTPVEERDMSWTNAPNPCESKKPSSNIKEGIKGSEAAKEAYLKMTKEEIGGSHVCVQVVNDSVFVKFNPDTKQWEPIKQREDASPDMARTTWRAFESFQQLMASVTLENKNVNLDPRKSANCIKRLNACFGFIVNVTEEGVEKKYHSEFETALQMKIRELTNLSKQLLGVQIVDPVDFNALKALLETDLRTLGKPYPKMLDKPEMKNQISENPTLKDLLPSDYVTLLANLASRLDITNPAAQASVSQPKPASASDLSRSSSGEFSAGSESSLSSGEMETPASTPPLSESHNPVQANQENMQATHFMGSSELDNPPLTEQTLNNEDPDVIKLTESIIPNDSFNRNITPEDTFKRPIASEPVSPHEDPGVVRLTESIIPGDSFNRNTTLENTFERPIASEPVSAQATMQNINTPDSNGNTPLILAAQNGNIVEVEKLIAAGATVNHQNNRGETALHHAAKIGHGLIVKALLDNNATVSIKDNNDQTPVDIVLSKKENVADLFTHDQIMLKEYILAKNVPAFILLNLSQLNFSDKKLNREKEKLQSAIRKIKPNNTENNKDAFELLNKAIEKHGINSLGTELLKISDDILFPNNNIYSLTPSNELPSDETKNLSALAKDLYEKTEEQLHFAPKKRESAKQKKRYEALVSSFLNASEELKQTRDVSSLLNQLDNGRMKYFIANILRDMTNKKLENGSTESKQPSSVTNYRFYQSTKKTLGIDGIIDRHLTRTAEAKKAAGTEKTKQVRTVFNPTEQAKKLHEAIQRSDETLILEILANNQTIDDRYTGTPHLVQASKHANNNIVNLLLENADKFNFNINATDELNGNTALHEAALKGDAGILISLLNNDTTPKKSDPNIRNSEGKTPLMLAIEKGQPDIAKILIANQRINLNTKDRQNKTALDYAIQANNDELANAIRNKIAPVEPTRPRTQTQFEPPLFEGEEPSRNVQPAEAEDDFTGIADLFKENEPDAQPGIENIAQSEPVPSPKNNEQARARKPTAFVDPLSADFQPAPVVKDAPRPVVAQEAPAVIDTEELSSGIEKALNDLDSKQINIAEQDILTPVNMNDMSLADILEFKKNVEEAEKAIKNAKTQMDLIDIIPKNHPNNDALEAKKEELKQKRENLLRAMLPLNTKMQSFKPIIPTPAPEKTFLERFQARVTGDKRIPLHPFVKAAAEGDIKTIEKFIIADVLNHTQHARPQHNKAIEAAITNFKNPALHTLLQAPWTTWVKNIDHFKDVARNAQNLEAITHLNDALATIQLNQAIIIENAINTIPENQRIDKLAEITELLNPANITVDNAGEKYSKLCRVLDIQVPLIDKAIDKSLLESIYHIADNKLSDIRNKINEAARRQLASDLLSEAAASSTLQSDLNTLHHRFTDLLDEANKLSQSDNAALSAGYHDLDRKFTLLNYDYENFNEQYDLSHIADESLKATYKSIEDIKPALNTVMSAIYQRNTALAFDELLDIGERMSPKQPEAPKAPASSVPPQRRKFYVLDESLKDITAEAIHLSETINQYLNDTQLESFPRRFEEFKTKRGQIIERLHADGDQSLISVIAREKNKQPDNRDPIFLALVDQLETQIKTLDGAYQKLNEVKRDPALFIKERDAGKTVDPRDIENINLAFSEAVKNGDTDTVKQLLAGNLAEYIQLNRLNANEEPYLITAAKHQYNDIAKALIDHGALFISNNITKNIDNQEYTPLHHAAIHDNIALADLLAEQSSFHNYPDDLGHTPLMLAAYQNSTRVARLLAENLDTDLNLKNVRGETALMIAIQKGNLDVFNAILAANDKRLDHPLDLNAKNSLGQTPLHLAIQAGNDDMIDALIDLHVDMHIKDNNGHTAKQLLAANVDDQELDDIIASEAEEEEDDNSNEVEIIEDELSDDNPFFDPRIAFQKATELSDDQMQVLVELEDIEALLDQKPSVENIDSIERQLKAIAKNVKDLSSLYNKLLKAEDIPTNKTPAGTALATQLREQRAVLNERVTELSAKLAKTKANLHAEKNKNKKSTATSVNAGAQPKSPQAKTASSNAPSAHRISILLAQMRAYNGRIDALAKVAANAAGSETVSRSKGDLDKITNHLDIPQKDINTSLSDAEAVIAANRDPKEVQAANALHSAATELQHKVDQIKTNVDLARERASRDAAERVIHRGQVSSASPLTGEKHYQAAVKQLTEEFFDGIAPVHTGNLQTYQSEIDISKPVHTTWTGHIYDQGQVLAGVVRTAGETKVSGTQHHQHDIYFRQGDLPKLQGHRQRSGLFGTSIPNDIAMQFALDLVIGYKNDVNLIRDKSAHINARALPPDAVEAIQIVCAIHDIDPGISGGKKMAKDELIKHVKAAKEIYRGQLLTVSDATSISVDPSHKARRSP